MLSPVNNGVLGTQCMDSQTIAATNSNLESGSGEINSLVADSWRAWDLVFYVRDNWSSIGAAFLVNYNSGWATWTISISPTVCVF
ncbi:MAG: hypothetical protein CM1200mP40_25220 [Gammaproteobacteria bacterium]|nr:MAG: hypothetical protein CM1200mP40_25220 [Gammaproteobacteria bacterium]